jgi:hypothetical protein
MDIKDFHKVIHAGDTFYGYVAHSTEPNNACDKCAFKGHFNCTLVICKEFVDDYETNIDVVSSVYFTKE